MSSRDMIRGDTGGRYRREIQEGIQEVYTGGSYSR